MAKFRLELYDSADSVRQAVIPSNDLISAVRMDELNGENSLSVSISRSSEVWGLIDNLKIIRVINLDDGSYEPFRIRQKRDVRDESGVVTGQIECEHIKYDMLGEIYAKWTPFVNGDPSTILSEILGVSSFSVGTISSAAKVDIELKFSPVLELVEDLRESLDTDMTVSNDKTVSIKKRGSSSNAKIRYTRNLTGIRKNIDIRDLFNVVYPVGGGEPPVDIGGDDVLGVEGAEHILTAISGATLSAHNRLVPSNDSWNNYYVELTRAISSATVGARRLITDSIAGSQVVVTTAFSGLTVGDHFKIVADSAGTDIKHIRDAGSIGSYGTIESIFHETSIVEARNLLFNPDFSGIFVSGLAENWSAITIGGNFPISSNTNPDFVRYGTKSQKIVDADAGEGIKQSITLVTNYVYSLYVWVYVSSSKVKLELYDGVTDQPSAAGKTAETSQTGVWTQLMLDGIAAQGVNGSVKILSNSASSDFYVDSVMLEKAGRLSVPNEFYPISGARLLWDRGFDALQSNKDPKSKYKVSILDLFEADPDGYPYDRLEVGDTIRLQDDELGIDVQARIKSKRWNVLEPWDAELEIDRHTDRLPRRIKMENQKRKRLDINVADLMGRRVDDRKFEDPTLIINVRQGGDIF